MRLAQFMVPVSQATKIVHGQPKVHEKMSVEQPASVEEPNFTVLDMDDLVRLGETLHSWQHNFMWAAISSEFCMNKI